jgi:hypothetical protein
VYGIGIADIDEDGTPEIGVGSYGGTPSGWLFEWNGTGYEMVWHGEYSGGEPVIESVALGDADNDGHQEFVFGTQQVHIVGWDGASYYEKATLTDAPPVDPRVHDLYLRGRYHWSKRLPEDLTRSIEYFKSAIALDTLFAPAYAAAAEVYVVIANWGYADPRDTYARAKEYAEKASRSTARFPARGRPSARWRSISITER